MRTSRTHQPLTYDVRLPNEAQADALRLLDASRAVINQALTLPWPSLDEFGSERDFPAWKQVGKYMGSPQYHGDRQWRCESEVVGRLLRQQAERKKALAKLLPVQREDFEGVFKAMDGFPVTIRLLDPPLHEFLPRREELMVEIAQLEIKDANSPRLKEARELLRRVEELHE